MAENSVASSEGHATHRKLLVGIIIAVILGTILGGFAPEVGKKFSIFGEVFLRALRMIVVPLVMFSIMDGVTNLGTTKNLGNIGYRTIIYYMLTTGLSVIVGIILVNIIQPGKGMSAGESHADWGYTLGGENSRTVTAAGNKWDRKIYDSKYMVYLLDQKVKGSVDSMTENSLTVKRWNALDVEHFIRTDGGILVPFNTVDGKLVSEEAAVKPSGKGIQIELPVASKVKGKEGRGVLNTLKDVFLGAIPKNLFKAMAEADVLPLIVFSILFALALSSFGDRASTAIGLISSINEAIMQIVWWIMVIAPIGIFGLLAARIGNAGGFEGFLPELMALGKYSFTVVLGLAVHGIIILPLILSLIARRNPIAYVANMGAALLNAFSTASSSATLPLTMEGVEKENKISNRTASFVLPLGATVNMDGTALYEAVAAMFIAQVYGIDLSVGQQVIIFLTATLAAIGAAGIPEAGLVTMVIVLKAVDLPIEGIGLLLAIDWLLDRFRTTVNVWGDSVGAAVIDRYEALEGARETG